NLHSLPCRQLSDERTQSISSPGKPFLKPPALFTTFLPLQFGCGGIPRPQADSSTLDVSLSATDLPQSRCEKYAVHLLGLLATGLMQVFILSPPVATLVRLRKLFSFRVKVRSSNGWLE